MNHRPSTANSATAPRRAATLELGLAVRRGDGRDLVGRQTGGRGSLGDLVDGHHLEAGRPRVCRELGAHGLDRQGRSFSTMLANPLVKPISRTAPISAVPSDAPRFCAVPCSPPASLVWSGGDGRHDDVPELRRQQSRHRPRTAPSRARTRSLSSTSSVARTATAPAVTATSPSRATAFGERPRGEPRSRQRRDEHRDRHRDQPLAGVEGIQADDDLEIDGQDEERAQQDELLDPERRQAGAEMDDVEKREVEQPIAPVPGHPQFPGREGPQDPESAEDQERHEGEPQRGDHPTVDLGVAGRDDETPGTALEDREHDDRHPGRREGGTDQVEPWRMLGPRARHHPSAEEQDDRDDDDLADEHVAATRSRSSRSRR